MNIRRVVTRNDATGKSVVASDGFPIRGKNFTHIPGFAQFLIWSTEARLTLLNAGIDPTQGVASFHPDPGETRFLVVTMPPDTVMTEPTFDSAAALQEHLQETPGIVDRFEPDHPGMHTTDTIDYGIVLEGEIWLELDDKKMVHLRTHDMYVLNGTRHAWRNKGDRPATLAVVLIGTRKCK
jgi:hypothetical protein